MQAQAQLKFFRHSPRKFKLVIDAVRGLSVSRALTNLGVMPQAAARPVAKLIASAAANAEVKQGGKLELWVSRIEVGQGPVLKRYRPRAMGRGAPIHKPTAHLKVVVSDMAPTKKGSR